MDYSKKSMISNDPANDKLIDGSTNYNYSIYGIGNSVKDDDTSISGKSQPI